MKKYLLFSLLILLVLTSCGNSGQTDAVTEAKVNATDISESGYTEWIPINKNSVITVNGITPDTLYVVRTNAKTSTLQENTKGSASAQGVVASSKTGNHVINGIGGNPEIPGSSLGLSSSTVMARIESIPINKINKSNYLTNELTVRDSDWKYKDKIAGSNNDYDYYIAEKAMYLDISDISQGSGAIDLSESVLTTTFYYWDGPIAEANGNKNFEGVHNTRNTYGFLIYDENNKTFEVVNSGVIDLSGKDNVLLYGGFASTVVVGSGISLNICQLKEISGSTTSVIIDTTNSAIGIKKPSDSDGKIYALKVSNITPNSFSDYSLHDNSTEIRKYNGEKVNSVNYPMTYKVGDDAFYYYIGEIKDDIYVNNNMKDGAQKNSNQNYGTAELVDITNDNSLRIKATKGNSVVFEINTTGTDGLSSSGGVTTYSRISSQIDSGHKKSGNLSLLLTDAPSSLTYDVKFEKYNGSSWEEFYDNSLAQTVVNYYNSGNNQTKNISVSTTNGECPVRFVYYGVEQPIKATITFK